MYVNTQDMFASDLVNSLQGYKDLDIVDIRTAEKIMQIAGIEKEYETFREQMTEASNKGDFKLLDEICNRMTELQERENTLYEQLNEAETALKQLETEELL